MLKYLFMPLTLALSGCAGFAQSVDEYRQTNADNKRTVTVDRTYRRTIDSIDAQFTNCLSGAITYVETGNQGGSRTTSAFNPSQMIGENSSEFVLQNKVTGNVVNVAKVPDGGWYTHVFDVYPNDQDSTYVDIYRYKGWADTANSKEKRIEELVLSWASGETEECPTLLEITE